MSTKSRKVDASDFLSKMRILDEPESVAQPVVKPIAEPEVRQEARAVEQPAPVKTAPAPTKRAIAKRPPVRSTSNAPANRSGLKHLGAYLMPDDIEKVALLRARLQLNNSQLIELAIQELYRAEAAKRKFGG